MITDRDKINKKSNEEMAQAITNSVGIVIKEDDNYDPYEQIDYNPKHEEIDLDTMQPVKTADEMFREIDYDKLDIKKELIKINYWGNACGYISRDNNDVILIIKLKHEIVYIKQSRTSFYARSITEDEDIAIHKKIEEMKHA